MDEIDYYVKHTEDSSVLYEISRLEEFLEPGETTNVLGVTFIARGREFHKLLDEGILSSLGRIVLEFKPYSFSQLVDILESRVREAFNPNVVSQDLVEYVAEIVSKPPVNGDVRYALDILQYSGNLAEYEGYDRITPEHVRKVLNITYPTVTDEDIYYLPEKDKIVLLGLARVLKGSGKPYASLKDIRMSCGIVCEEFNFKPLSSEDVENCVDDLQDRGIVEIRSLKSIGLNGVPAESLEQFLENLMTRLGSGLSGA